LRIAFRWMEQICTVEAPAAIAGDLASLFPQMVRSAHPSVPADVRVVPESGGFTVASDEVIACDRALSALGAAELAVTRRLLASDTEHCHVHAAAALAPDGRAILAVGSSGSGKSALAFAWCRTGRPLLGDDVVAIDRVHAFPRPLKVDAARLREAGESPEDTIAWDLGTSEAWVDPTRYAGWAVGGAPVGLLADVRFVPASDVRTREVSRAAALRMLLAAVHQTGVSRAHSVDRLIEVVKGSAAYEVRFGDAVDAAARLVALAER